MSQLESEQTNRALWPVRGREARTRTSYFCLGILVDNMVGCPATSDAKPFLKLGVPSDFRMFHCECCPSLRNLEGPAKNSKEFPRWDHLAQQCHTRGSASCATVESAYHRALRSWCFQGKRGLMPYENKCGRRMPWTIGSASESSYSVLEPER